MRFGAVAGHDRRRLVRVCTRKQPIDANVQSAGVHGSYRPKAHSLRVPAESWAGTHDFVEKVLVEEDYKMAAEQHRNLACAPADHEIVYGRNEVGIQHARAHIKAFTQGVDLTGDARSSVKDDPDANALRGAGDGRPRGVARASEMRGRD